ncbi:S-layer homology domain-containing protein [Paenibacillus sp. J5C_2022]|uniref:S-layer homology domain-containing protein n=1 Tax=Paenibacillus sp. J5C2022 TaxID=2977129 RepID=UPI0021CEDE6E|nr:S-layer homology domain-containing protein [Paenibacillus sp. J5C2022]MCU6707819.1 S-layer homology domain-containing protein [Paenibacillus sp. J5C2022]
MFKRLGVILLAICLSGVWNVIGHLNAERVSAAEETGSALAEADFNYVISDFEQGTDDWAFSLGDTPAVQGSFSVIESVYSAQGNYTGQLSADFRQRPTGSPYVLIKKEMGGLDITQMAFWVKTSDLKSIRLRTTDSTGQTFQQRITLQDTSDWQQVVINEMGSESFEYWNGANDGIWHTPTNNISILFDRFDIKNGALTAAVLVDQITAQVILPPEDFDNVISDFEQEHDVWAFSFGDTPAVKSSYQVIESVKSYKGSRAGQILADFSQRPTGSPYASIKKELDDLDIEQMAFWIKTSDLKSVRIRTTDSTGQTFQQRITLQDTSDWQQVVINEMGSNSFEYWNGANDGEWHKPATAITILFDRFDIKNPALTATVLIDQITAQTGDWLPELKIQQTTLGNIFLDNEPSTFIVRSSWSTINWAAYDIYGEQVASGSENTNAGQAGITVPFSKLGYFTLEVTVERPGSEPLFRKSAYAVVSSTLPPGNGDSPFGINTHLNRTAGGWSKELAEIIRYMGASYVRDGVEWMTLEKEKGIYTFEPSPDDYMRKLAENDLKLLLVAAFNNPFYDNNGTPYTDAGRKGFAEYAKAYVGRYKDQLIGYNVYNEFNGGFGKRGNSPANSQPDYYFKLMKETYNAVKPAYPDVPAVGIVSGGIDLDWIESVFKGVGEGEDKNAGLNYLDAVSIQKYMDPYAPDEVFDKLEDLKTLIKQYNDGQLVPIWVTEFGSPTHQAAKGVDEKTQANYLLRAFVLGLGHGVERMSWYDFMNDGLQPDYNEDNFGLIRHKNDPMGAYTPKPAYASYAATSRQLADAVFQEIESFGSAISSHLFMKDGEALRVVWAQQETQAVIETNNNLEITDLMGNTEIYTPYNGKIYMTLSGEPFYIKGSIERIVQDDTFAAVGEQAAIGDPYTFIVTMNNETGSQQLAVTAKMQENSYSLTAAQGQSAELSLTIDETRDGFRSVVVYLLDGAGQKIGKLRHEVATGMSHKVTIRPALQQNEGSLTQILNVNVENFREAADLTVNSIAWKVGGQSGQKLVNTIIQPGGKQLFSIPLDPIALGGDQQASIRVEFAQQDPYVYTGNFSFNPVNRGTIAINDQIEPEIDVIPPTIDLSQGKPVLLSGHTGSIEVRGQVWLHYDQDHLYLTAKIKDDAHAAPASGADIWNNDSIQFALSPGIPGESMGWYEYGISDTPNGTQIYRWTTMGELPAGPVSNSQAEVTRDEEKKLTIYKLALPWSELTPIRPERGDVMSLSLLVNDNNGDGRRGWMEWGSGIGLEKRASLFRSMQWMFNQAVPSVQDDAYNVKAGQNVQGILQAEHAEGTKLTFEIVANGKKGTVVLTDAAQGKFVYTADADVLGEDTFTFRVYDGYEYSDLGTIKVDIEKAVVTPPYQGGPVYIPSSNISHTGQLYLPGKAAGEISLGNIAKLIIAEGTTDQSAKLSLLKLEDKEIGGQDGLRWQLLSSLIEVQGEPEVKLNNPLLLRLAFDKQKLRESQYPSIWQYDEKQEKWIEIGGEADGDMIQAEIGSFGEFAVFAAPENPQFLFKDTAGHWAIEQMNNAVEQGMIKGYSDGTFKPDRSVSRAEFLVMLYRTWNKGQADVSMKTFADDTAIQDWARDAVYHAATAGWVSGYEDGTFRPNQQISRAEMAVVLARVLSLESVTAEVEEITFSDAADIPKWATGAVLSCVRAGLLQGKGLAFDPVSATTRAEAITVLLRIQDSKQ